MSIARGDAGVAATQKALRYSLRARKTAALHWERPINRFVTTLSLEAETSARSTPSFVSAPPTLNDLAIHYGTDKRAGIHSYTKWYEALFAPRRWQQLTMLE